MDTDTTTRAADAELPDADAREAEASDAAVEYAEDRLGTDDDGAVTDGAGAEDAGAGADGPEVTFPRGLFGRIRVALSGDAGMSTVEYALGTIAAAAFGAVLYVVVTGDSIPDALTDIIERALNTDV